MSEDKKNNVMKAGPDGEGDDRAGAGRLMSDDANLPRRRHMAMAVDVDRFDDKYLAKRVCPTFTLPSGKHPTPAHLRILCAQARAKGLEVFPPCDHVDERGHCLGHPERDTGEEAINTALGQSEGHVQ